MEIKKENFYMDGRNLTVTFTTFTGATIVVGAYLVDRGYIEDIEITVNGLIPLSSEERDELIKRAEDYFYAVDYDEVLSQE